MSRQYTLEEIQFMRGAVAQQIRQEHRDATGQYVTPAAEIVEDWLQTYILGGIDPKQFDPKWRPASEREQRPSLPFPPNG